MMTTAAIALIGYFAFFSGSRKAPFTLTDKTAGKVDVALEGRWLATRDSRAGYRVREKLAALPARSDAVGRTSAVTGSLTVERRGDELVVAKGARIAVDMRTLNSDETRRDERMHTAGLESDRYPTAGFVSDFDVVVPAAAERGDKVHLVLRGELTLHGVTRAIALPMDAQIRGGRIEVVGRLDVLMGDFRIHPPDIVHFVTVDTHGSMEYDLVFRKSGTQSSSSS